MKILVVGHRGQLGWELMRRADRKGFDAAGYDLPELDISREKEIDDLINGSGASCIINAAAFTAVDLAEERELEAYTVNRDGVGNLALACCRARVPLIHISTYYFFY